jgi:hypothetical protein
MILFIFYECFSQELRAFECSAYMIQLNIKQQLPLVVRLEKRLVLLRNVNIALSHVYIAFYSLTIRIYDLYVVWYSYVFPPNLSPFH